MLTTHCSEMVARKAKLTAGRESNFQYERWRCFSMLEKLVSTHTTMVRFGAQCNVVNWNYVVLRFAISLASGFSLRRWHLMPPWSPFIITAQWFYGPCQCNCIAITLHAPLRYNIRYNNPKHSDCEMSWLAHFHLAALNHPPHDLLSFDLMPVFIM